LTRKPRFGGAFVVLGLRGNGALPILRLRDAAPGETQLLGR
jgi:hypothetical protein